MEFNAKQQQCHKLIMDGRNVVILGQAGCGKTMFIERIVRDLRAAGKNVQVTSMTAISAIPIGGITLHKFIGMREKIGTVNQLKGFNKHLRAKIPKFHVLIIDEVSMKNGEMIELLDEMLRFARQNEEPFGGMQIIMSGDLKQLAPVVNDRKILFEGDMGAKFTHDDIYFITTDAFRAGKFTLVEFDKVYRQDDQAFISLLGALRRNSLSITHINTLKSRDISNFPDVNVDEMVQLFPDNKKVVAINKSRLEKLPGDLICITTLGSTNKQNDKKMVELKKFGMDIIETKIGALMMIRKNIDIEKHLVNGKVGVLESITYALSGDVLTMNLRVDVNGNSSVHEISRYVFNEPETGAKLEQFPLTLAYAFTIHKAQGMSLDRVFINFGITTEPHIHYVAISRVRKLDGLYMRNFNETKIRIHPELLKIESALKNYFAEVVTN